MNILAYSAAMLSAILGMGSIAVFTAFLYIGPLHLVLLPFNNIEILLFDAGLCLVFFIQHSVMVRQGFKYSLAKFIPTIYFGAFFSIISGVTLFALMLLWQESSLMLISATGLARWLVRGTFVLVLAVQMWALFALRAIDLFGIQVLMGNSRPTQPSEAILLAGAYGWVRHPIYTTSIILIWCYPDLTADRLLLNMLFSLWIVMGAIWEERDLVAMHGEHYRDYQRQVPMLIPYRRPRM